MLEERIVSTGVPDSQIALTDEDEIRMVPIDAKSFACDLTLNCCRLMRT